MTTDDLPLTSAARLAEGFARKSFTPVDALAACRKRIEQGNELLNAFVAFSDVAAAEAEASAARHAAGKPLSALDGVPVAIKDNMAVKGMPATWGSPYLADFVPAADELPVARLRDAGAVIVGKTNVPEFTLEGYTGNPVYGVTGNPWNPALTPGGSSGGSVASVAAGMLPVALGTDGGGSIRRPVAYTGLVGLKPSIGKVARSGGLPQILLDFEVVGPIARSVADLAAVFGVIAGPSRLDHRSRRFGANGQATGKRILFVERLGDAPLDPVIAASVSRAADNLAALGYEVARGPLPFDIDRITQFWQSVGKVGLAKMAAADPAMRVKATPKYMAMADEGAAVSGTDFLAGLEVVGELRDATARAFETIDMIMTPSCAAMPWPKAEAFPPTIDGKPVGPRGHAVYTGWVNATGHPGISIPGPLSADGMPIGFQLIGDMGSDAALIETARAYEAAYPWADRFPKIF